jgi:hypothetical protein
VVLNIVIANMTTKSHMTFLLISLLLVSNAGTLQSAQDPLGTVASRSYKVSTVGSVEMSVPVHWQENVRLLEVPPGFTLAYRLAFTKDFYMKVTSAWEPQQERSSRDPGWLRIAVEKAGVALDEDRLRLNEISSPSAKGYYFQLAHKEKFPIGEFKYLLEGTVDLGTITVVFSAYSNKKDAPEFIEALKVIQSARFVPAN